MTPASPAADTVIAVFEGVPSEQSHRAAAPSVPSSYAVWEKERSLTISVHGPGSDSAGANNTREATQRTEPPEPGSRGFPARHAHGRERIFASHARRADRCAVSDPEAGRPPPTAARALPIDATAALIGRARGTHPRRVGSNSTTPPSPDHLASPSRPHPSVHPPHPHPRPPRPLRLRPFSSPPSRLRLRLRRPVRLRVLLPDPETTRRGSLSCGGREGASSLYTPAGGQPPHGPVACARYISAHRPAESCVRAVKNKGAFFRGFKRGVGRRACCCPGKQLSKGLEIFDERISLVHVTSHVISDKMSSLNKVVPNSGDACSVLPSKVTALNPNAAEFVPSFIRPSFGTSTVPDVAKSEFRGSSGKTILDRSESSKSNNSDDEAHQFWRKQLPDDIIPDFTFEKIEQGPEELSLAGLSLNAPPFYGTTSSRFLREHHELSSPACKGLELEHSNVLYEDNSQTAFSALGSSNWEQNYMGDLHFANGNQDLPFDSESTAGFSDSFASEFAAASDGVVDPLEYLAAQFPGFSAESLAELYYANGCDFNHTIEILTQLEMQVDATPSHTLNLTSTPNFSTGDFPALPTAEDHNGLNKGNVDVIGIFNGRGSSTISSGTGDFVSAVRKLASQNSGHWKFKKGHEYGNGVSGLSVPKQYSSSTKQSSGNKFQSVNSARVAPWLETGDAVANMYSELREEARDFARVRNACFEQARQAYLVGNKALAKELSMKGQAYNAQMKAAHEKARETIYRQRNPVSSQRGSDRLIDLHGLHVSEAIHILKIELAALKSAARTAGERMRVMVCVGTGHHTKGSRTARLPIAVEQFLLGEGLHYTQPQPGLLRVMVY